MSEAEIHEIDSAVDFDAGFPMNCKQPSMVMVFRFWKVTNFSLMIAVIFRNTTYHTHLTAADVSLTKAVAHIEAVPHPAPIQHRQREL